MTGSDFDEEHEMTFTDAGEELRPLLTAAVADAPASADLLTGVRRRVRRRRHVMVPAGVAAACATVAGVVSVVSVSEAPSARAAVSAAAEHSSDLSFRVRITGGYQGEFDPAHRTGRLTGPDGQDVRFVGDTVYLRAGIGGKEGTVGKGPSLPPGKHWVSMPRPSEAELARMGPAIAVLKLGPVDPQLVLARLRSATVVHETGAASGAGWTGHRYSFALRDTDNVKRPAGTISGTVTVDTRGLVRAMSMTNSTEGGGGPSVLEFGDYGTAVNVTAPPPGEVIDGDQVRVPAKPEHKPGAGKSSPK